MAINSIMRGEHLGAMQEAEVQAFAEICRNKELKFLLRVLLQHCNSCSCRGSSCFSPARPSLGLGTCSSSSVSPGKKVAIKCFPSLLGMRTRFDEDSCHLVIPLDNILFSFAQI